ncbi:Protein arginine methyltransferase NDUFAF7 [Gracilaria domingensis]|nr:Protein arginine methyltransferase NDUFAF7 [Gracilaria domingensis]
MRLCLTHPQYGYYTTHPSIFGADGDFITAPHVTPVFSQLLGVWIANHVTTNSLTDFELIELGPGTGRMLLDLLPTLDKLRATPSSLTLFEASSELRKVQEKALSSLPKMPNTRWAATLSEALDSTPKRPVIVVAHEFFDALPVHVLQKASSQATSQLQWRERLVDISECSTVENPSFRFVLSKAVTPAVALAQSLQQKQCLPDCPVVEICADGISTAQRLAESINQRGGAALLIDYGSDTITKDTVRALSKHDVADVLARPGECDVTADVNFSHLRHGVSSVPSMRLWGSITQREFLLRLGAAERFRVIGRSVIAGGGSDQDVDEKLVRLQQDYDRIVGVGEQNMGEVYKAAVISNEQDGAPFCFGQQIQ